MRVAERGYTALKFDPFGKGREELSREEMRVAFGLIEAVAEVCKARGMDFFLEMHGRFSPATAIQIAGRLAKFDLDAAWIEEPIRPDYDMSCHKRVADAVSPMGIKIASGERLYRMHDFVELMRAGVVDVLQPDINQCGGLAEVKTLARVAEEFGVVVAPHNVSGIISTCAALHLMATLKNGKILEHFNDFADSHVKGCGTPYPEVRAGYFSLPCGPGWGAEPDRDFIKSLPPPRTKRGAILDGGLNMLRNPDWNRRGQEHLGGDRKVH